MPDPKTLRQAPTCVCERAWYSSRLTTNGVKTVTSTLLSLDGAKGCRSSFTSYFERSSVRMSSPRPLRTSFWIEFSTTEFQREAVVGAWTSPNSSKAKDCDSAIKRLGFCASEISVETGSANNPSQVGENLSTLPSGSTDAAKKENSGKKAKGNRRLCPLFARYEIGSTRRHTWYDATVSLSDRDGSSMPDAEAGGRVTESIDGLSSACELFSSSALTSTDSSRGSRLWSPSRQTRKLRTWSRNSMNLSLDLERRAENSLDDRQFPEELELRNFSFRE